MGTVRRGGQSLIFFWHPCEIVHKYFVYNIFSTTDRDDRKSHGGMFLEVPKRMRSIRFSTERYIPELLSLHKSKQKMFGIYLFISGQEIIFAVLIALLLFGSKEIPKLARTFGKGMKEFRKATEDIKKEFESSTPEIAEDFKEIKKNLTKDADEIKRNLTKDANDIAKGVKKNMDID